MPTRKLAVAILGLAAIAVTALLVRRRDSRSPAGGLAAPLIPFNPDAPVRIDSSRPLVIRGVPPIAAPLSALDEFSIALGDAIGPAVDQLKDSLKGLGLWSKQVPARFRDLFAMAGSQYRLPPGLLEAVAYRESRFRDDIIDGRVRSAAGAVGIMQIVPKWHPELGEAGALDPLRAVPYAAQYLRSLFVRFGHWSQALAAYNWGPANQLKDLADQIVGDDWPEETRIYVAEITANAGLA